MNDIPLWEEITREERYFCSFLFHDIRSNPAPFMTLLRDEGLPTSPESKIIDVGYEVCFFRDSAKVELIERQSHLEKQTFDLVLWLSDGSLVIIEAKAQQGFGMDQLKKLEDSKLIITGSSYPVSRIHLVGLVSSKYSPQADVKSVLNPILMWDEMMTTYPVNAHIYQRADEIYGK